MHIIGSMFNLNKITVLSLTLSLFLLLPLISSPSIQNFNYANASLSIGQSIQQFQHNLQESINEELQSIFESNMHINSSNNCDSNNSISIQSQTNNNGITTSSIWNLCDSSNFFGSLSSTSESQNLHGKIVSSEYNINTGTIANSLFGNWSLITTKDNGSIDFNATFIKHPIYYNTSSVTFAGNNFSASIDTEFNNTESSLNNNTRYHLSNFVVNSIQQINDDITYSGKIDVVKEIVSPDTNHSIRTSTFNDVKVSVSVFDDKVLFIQLDNQSKLSDEFRNIPLVGVVQ
ncbi:MAG: hypothetical protein L0H53_11665, partial [Candidatus Nitrosocosmicus sp.]|nr:hypothetical protein [Candidatus Nitrosocosmicus sp.]MDN5867276.1 hypothetical protein [Candidatus Nitrosocosmicus sp.]